MLIENNNFSSYMSGQKKTNSFDIVNFYGDEKQKNKVIKIIDLIFQGEFQSIDYITTFYYSINGNKEDNSLLSSFESEKFTLINPLKNLKFDDHCKQSITKINASAYSELGHVFGGVDV